MPGLNNFLVWNPSQINQETDAQYSADSQRTGGAPVGTPFPSRTGNKVLYQCSTGVAALMQMMANKGFNVTDVNFGNLASVLSAIQTTADIKAPLITIPYSPSPVFNAALTSTFQMTLSGNSTSGSIANWFPGQVINFIIVQGSGGGFQFSMTGINGWPPILNPAAGAVTVVQIIARADNTLWAAEQPYLGFTPAQQGGGIGQIANKVYIGWSTPDRLKATVDTTDLGNFVFDTQLNATQATLQGEINATNSQVGTINSEISTINSEIGTINSNISTINGILAAFTGSFAANGWVAIRLNGGAQFIIQWGSTGDFDGAGGVTFPIAFPVVCWMAMGTDRFGGSSRIVSTSAVSRTGATFQKDGVGNGIYWIAVGA